MPTLEDVARAAGVSTATVSRVLNAPQKVTVTTRERVERAIRTLNYQPSRVARRLRMRTHTAHMLGLMVPDMQNPFFSDVARGVEDVAYEHRHALIVCNSDECAEKEEFYLQTMRAESVDGIILPITDRESVSVERLLQDGKPVVCVDRRSKRLNIDTVLVDNERAAYDAVTHLIELGHSRIGIIVGLRHLSTSQDRLAGYKQALSDYAIPYDPELVRFGNSRQESGRQGALALLDLADRPTALFPANNMMTLGSLEALQQRGLRIPDEMALLGFDDFPWANAFNPPLSVVRQPSYAIGREAAKLLLERIHTPNRPYITIVLQHELVIRQSCGYAAQTAML